jgi:hypothetical protein
MANSSLSLPELFQVANAANNPLDRLWIPEGNTFVQTVAYGGTMKALLFQTEDTMTISFSSLTTTDGVMDFCVKGWEMIRDQDLVRVSGSDEEPFRINNYFNKWSKMFVDATIEIINAFFSEQGNKKLVLTGMSMGGAMSHGFAYNLHANYDFPHRVEVLAFGSPRIGNKYLNDWIVKYCIVTNYSIIVKMEGLDYVDPVIHFPCKDVDYVNNPNLVLKRDHKIVFDKPINSMTNISASNFIKEWSFIPLDVLPAWNLIHQFQSYMDNL